MLKSPSATHSGNGVRADRPRMRTRPQPELGPAFRRNRLLRLGLVLLLGVCVLRLAAEAWQRGGRNVYILSAFAGKSARPGLDSAMFYTVETPPLPVESVLTSDVAYGKRLSLRHPPWAITCHACPEAGIESSALESHGQCSEGLLSSLYGSRPLHDSITQLKRQRAPER